jgi:hypothetical protein
VRPRPRTLAAVAFPASRRSPPRRPPPPAAAGDLGLVGRLAASSRPPTHRNKNAAMHARGGRTPLAPTPLRGVHATLTGWQSSVLGRASAALSRCRRPPQFGWAAATPHRGLPPAAAAERIRGFRAARSAGERSAASANRLVPRTVRKSWPPRSARAHSVRARAPGRLGATGSGVFDPRRRRVRRRRCSATFQPRFPPQPPFPAGGVHGGAWPQPSGPALDTLLALGTLAPPGAPPLAPN